MRLHVQPWCGRPNDVHVLIPETCDQAPLQGKRDFGDAINLRSWDAECYLDYSVSPVYSQGSKSERGEATTDAGVEVMHFQDTGTRGTSKSEKRLAKEINQ